MLERYFKKASEKFAEPFIYVLIKLKVKAIKISSCNLTNIPFLKIAAKTKIPILLSTGMAKIEEVKKL